MRKPQNMIQTILIKIFRVMTASYDFTLIFGESVKKENSKLQDIEDWFDRLGSNFGKLLRYANDFDPKVIPLILGSDSMIYKCC